MQSGVFLVVLPVPCRMLFSNTHNHPMIVHPKVIPCVHFMEWDLAEWHDAPWDLVDVPTP